MTDNIKEKLEYLKNNAETQYKVLKEIADNPNRTLSDIAESCGLNSRQHVWIAVDNLKASGLIKSKDQKFYSHYVIDSVKELL